MKDWKKDCIFFTLWLLGSMMLFVGGIFILCKIGSAIF